MARQPCTSCTSAYSSNERVAHTTVMTACVHLTEKGLLERRQIRAADGQARHGDPYLYTPRMSETQFLQAAVARHLNDLISCFPTLISAAPGVPPRLRQPCATDRGSIEQLLAYIGALSDQDGQHTNDTALDQIVTLLERAEAAERQATTWEVAARRAERRAQVAERQVRDLQAELARERGEPRELRSPTQLPPVAGSLGVCRVCGKPAPPPHGRRRDGLRVCRDETCRTEARRRDNVTKVQRYTARQRVKNVD